MKSLLFSCLFSLLIVSVSKAQNQFQFLDGKTYAATSILDFTCEEYTYNNILSVQIAKTPTGGILKLSTKTSDISNKIGDKVLLILKNGSIIHCIDKKLFETKENVQVSYYIFSAIEMKQLTTHIIENIRFSIIGKQVKFGSQTGNFSANNREINYGYEKSTKSKYDTVLEVKSLLKKI